MTPAPEHDLSPEADPEADLSDLADSADGDRHRRTRYLPGCLAVMVAAAVLVGAGYFVVTRGVEALRSQFETVEDYSGAGRGSVVFEVEEGDTAAQIGRDLKAEGVVASVESFIDAAAAEPDSERIQVGFYELRKRMPAADALDVLVDPANLLKDTVTVPEGLRVVDIVEILAQETDFPRAGFERALADPERLGLPAAAEGNPEGYLFPSTYDFGPEDRPASMLAAMVDRWKQAAEEADLEGAAAELGYSPAELMVVASLVEAEGRGSDMPKIARVIYNRLEGEETDGLLQIDATVNYAVDQQLGAVPTTEDLEVDSPYNTYRNPGLPPTPIEAPGDAAIRAATQPADGGWYYYVTVNLRTGETKFAETYPEFLRYKGELREYCETQSDAC